jgi:hypothetical protein
MLKPGLKPKSQNRHRHRNRNATLPAWQVKGTVLLMPGGNDRVTLAPEQPVETDKKVEDPELVKLLNAGARGARKP